MEKWAPERCLELIDRYGVTASMMVPTMLHRLLLLPDETRAQFHLRSLRPNGIMVGGARCPAHTKSAMIEWWGPVFVESYGGSEAAFSRITSPEALAHPGSVGRGRPGVTLRVIDDAGNPCPPGVVGTIYARFDDATAHRPAYLNAPDKTAGSYVGEFFTLGDMGYIDEEGWLYLVDRRSDLIVSGGANIYPAEVERVLGAHDAVDDVVVIGVPDDEWGHVVHALVVVEHPADEMADELRAHCREFLAPYKCPKGFTFVPAIDRSEMGKVSRRKLREQFLGPTGVDVSVVQG
jgi:long-chain acyl-CoA synthetase